MYKLRLKGLRVFLFLFVFSIVLGGMGIDTLAATSNNLLGDVNSDGVIDSTDYSLMKRYLLTIVGINSINGANSDINGDGSIDSSDYAMLKRHLLGIIQISNPTNPSSESKKILVPHTSWTCGMPEGIPTPEDGTLVLEFDMKLEQVYNLGKTQYGNRQVFIIKSGTVTGSKINASVLSGGLDFQLDLSNGAMEIEQLLMLKTNDGKYIYMRNGGTAANDKDVRIVPGFEAPSSSSHSWLNTGKYVARRIVDTASKTMKMKVYDVSNVAIKPDSANSTKVTKPSGVQNQSWDFRRASGEKRGSQLIVESVSLGSSQSVGTTNKSNRNVIPITGGTVTGNINAKILPGGADYQNLSNPMTIDAKYLWQTDDGEIIIVRNAGQFGSLVPTFEVREDSKYAYLNNSLYLSSDPSMGGGGVTITFYNSVK